MLTQNKSTWIVGLTLTACLSLNAKPPVGIINDTGSNCYLNAVLQCLARTATAERLLAYRDTPFKANTPAAGLFEFMHRYATSATPIVPGPVADQIHRALGRGQQDSSDAFRTLMASISDDSITEIVQARTTSGQPPINSFVFHQAAQLAGQRHTQPNIAYYLGPLQPKAERTLEQLLRESFALQQTDTVTKQDYFRSTPTNLCVYLQRLERTSYAAQLDRLDTTPVRFPEVLDLLTISYPIPPEEERSVYQLVSFVKFVGDATGGHYVAYVRERENWYLCNDSSVTPARPNLSDPGATLLFYELVPVKGQITIQENKLYPDLTKTPLQSFPANTNSLNHPSPKSTWWSWWSRCKATLARPRTWLGLAGLALLTLFIGDRTGTF